MTQGIQHLSRANYLSMPWRNGLGRTLEIARAPSADEQFDWRLSLATVAGSGPFSPYARYRRSVTLVSGNGFRLDIAGQPPAVLDAVGKTALFSGNASTKCTLIDGAASDLSLMVREPGEIISVGLVQSDAARELPLPANAFNAVFCLQGRGLLARSHGEMTPSVCRPSTDVVELDIHDTVLLSASAPLTTLAASWSIRPVSDLPSIFLRLSWKVHEALPAYSCST